MSKQALIVFGKNPVPGFVKTRMGREIGAVAAADLYRAFLVDTLDRAAALNVSMRFYLAPTDQALHPDIVRFDTMGLRQRGISLGARMLDAFAETFAAGSERAVIVGSDHPTLPLSVIEAAFRALDAPHRIVVGPSVDGGYYLLGLTRPQPALFEGMAYSHAGVLAATLERAEACSLEVTLLPYWYDVDTVDDLNRLVRDLERDPGRSDNTSAVLSQLGLIENAR